MSPHWPGSPIAGEILFSLQPTTETIPGLSSESDPLVRVTPGWSAIRNLLSRAGLLESLPDCPSCGHNSPKRHGGTIPGQSDGPVNSRTVGPRLESRRTCRPPYSSADWKRPFQCAALLQVSACIASRSRLANSWSVAGSLRISHPVNTAISSSSGKTIRRCPPNPLPIQTYRCVPARGYSHHLNPYL